MDGKWNYINANTVEPCDILNAKRALVVIMPFAVVVGINLLTPNVNCSGRTAPLTSKVAFYIFIQQIYVLNILNTVYDLRFFFFKMQFVS